jgi:hypothetical protein
LPSICNKGSGPAAVGVDDFVDFSHEADGFVQGDDDALVVEDVFVGKRPASAVLELLFADLVAANMKVPDIVGDAIEPAGRIDIDLATGVSGITPCDFRVPLACKFRYEFL